MADSDNVNINGNSYDWEGVTISGPQGVLTGISELNWSSEKPKKDTYGKGAVRRGQTRGNYSAKFDMVLDPDEYDDLISSLSGGIYDSQFDFAVIMEGNRQHEIVLKQMTVDSLTDGAKNGDGEITQKLSGKVKMIHRDGKPEYEEK
ncbi:hypothetical protein [Maridesulfovibrio sp.]|uniref:hypothetical protein n=1 Tax=Maridesulfovibrio sp. TaxID=2795000 RepID=UPI002AA67E9C|nr:hypothetical protein [Maridesulfovibrio sp.]